MKNKNKSIDIVGNTIDINVEVQDENHKTKELTVQGIEELFPTEAFKGDEDGLKIKAGMIEMIEDSYDEN